MKIWILTTALLAAPFAHAQQSCSEVFTSRPKLAELEVLTDNAIAKLLSQFERDLDPQVLAGNRKPGWHDFDKLNNFISTVKTLKNELHDKPETAHMLEAVSAEIRALLLKNNHVNDFLQAKSEKLGPPAPYQPTERELKVSYQFYLRELNKILPREFRIPLKRLPFDKHRENLNTEAAQYLRKSEKVFAKRFAGSQYKSYENYEKALRTSLDPQVIKALKLIDQDQIEVVMRRPVLARFWTPKVGFHNQFVTGSSKGSLSPAWRNLAEANLYGNETKEVYELRDAEFKPKYGTLSVKPELEVTADLQSSRQYGGDIYAFKTENIKDRLSIFYDDSLGLGGRAGPHGDWSKLFIPWKYRLVLVPFLTRALVNNTFKSSSPEEYWVHSNVSSPRYYESQILGKVGLKDVSRFTFTEIPPEGEFLRELHRHEIDIYDGRDADPKNWHKWVP